jgi:hypothetical protein
VHSTWPNSVHENFYERPATDSSELGAWCYTDRLSYLPGEQISIHTCTTSDRYELAIYRDGATQTEVLVARELPGQFYQTPLDCSVSGCKWPIAKQVEVSPHWKSGGYILLIRAYGKDGAIAEHHFPFAIRTPQPSAPDAILLLNCTSTWVAYNDWGGSNFYEGILGEGRDQATPVASTLRPFSRGFAWLPDGAPRIPLREPLKMGAALRYPHMEWAYANGFSKKYASAGWATYERHFLRWAEGCGFTVDVATQHDLHRDPEILEGYRCVAIVGHDEYWSWQMRDAIDAYVSRGGRVARFAGNFGWQIRIEEEGTRQICYKWQAEAKDPIRNTAQKHLLTTAWDDPVVSRPGTLTFGLKASSGIYAGWGGCVPRGSGGFTVYRPEHWAFEGTDLYYGDQLGANAKVFGYEVDGCDYTIRGGLPYADGSDGAPKDMEIIALGLATTLEADHGNPGSTFFIGSADAQAVAYQRLRRSDQEAVDQVTRGAGMIVSFDRGNGSVFNAASCEWVSGLIERDPFVERLTHNVLARFTRMKHRLGASDSKS